jgi:hypothetical protein
LYVHCFFSLLVDGDDVYVVAAASGFVVVLAVLTRKYGSIFSYNSII